MNWNEFSQYLNDGTKAESFKQFHFSLVKGQVHWMAFLGKPRWHFNLITIFGLPATLLCYWIGYETEFTSIDTTDWTLFPLAIWWLISIPALSMPFLYPLHMIVSIITGAFTSEFWQCVYAIRKNTQ